MPLLFLVLLEAVLRLVGAGYPTEFFIPNKGGEGYVTNIKFGWRFFPPRVARWPSPQVLEAPKDKRAFRIFVLGESAAYGTPSDLYGFIRILHVMLSERFPDLEIEIVNAAMTAVNSHVILPIARDCAGMEPDLFIVYMGNNEVIGPYGAGSIFGRRFTAIPLIRAHIRLRSARLVQLFFSLFDWHGNYWGGVETWEGLAAFMDHKVAADDPRLRYVRGHFRRNLEDICRVAGRKGIPVLGCTVAVNLRDVPPFASVHRPGLTADETAAFDADFQRGQEAFDQGRWREALEAFRACVERDDCHADAHYWLAKAIQSLGDDPDKAVGHFLQARELDALRYRADAGLNAAVREVFSGAGSGRRLVDIERRLAEAAPGDVALPGDEFFHEHVHFNPAGNYKVAKALFEAAEPFVCEARGLEPAALFELPAPDACAARLGYTLIERHSFDRFMLEGMIGHPPFTHQVRHEQRYARKQAELASRYEGRLTAEARRAALASCEGEVARRPDDLYLRRALVNHYLELGLRTEAIRQLEYLVGRMPGDYILIAQLAGEHMHLGHDEEAGRLLRRAIAINPYYYVARHNLAVLMERKGRERPNREAGPGEILRPGQGT